MSKSLQQIAVNRLLAQPNHGIPNLVVNRLKSLEAENERLEQEIEGWNVVKDELLRELEEARDSLGDEINQSDYWRNTAQRIEVQAQKYYNALERIRMEAATSKDWWKFAHFAKDTVNEALATKQQASD